MAGEIGFDEGGVLDALRDEIYSETLTTYKRNKKGDVVSEKVRHMGVSATTIVFALVLIYGPEILALFKTGGLEILKNIPWPSFDLGGEEKSWAQGLSAAGRQELADKGEVTVTRGDKTWKIVLKKDWESILEESQK